MKKTILLIVIWGIAWTMAIAQNQQNRKEVYPKQASIEHNDAVKNFSSDFVTAFSGLDLFHDLGFSLSGMNNTGSIDVLGSNNISVLSQQGYNIFGDINIEGDNNTTQLNQAGLNLSSVIDIMGDHNSLGMTQFGIGLQNHLQISGTNLQFNALHTNFGFQLQQQGVGSIPLTIQNTGNSIPIIITNN